MKILLDNGHGSNTAGKRSPDGRLLEYKWAREIVLMLQEALREKGLSSYRICPEDYDVSLKSRCLRVNEFCRVYGASNCLLISIHVNAAAGHGKWNTATGWSGWVAPKSSKNSKLFARLCHIEAEKRGLRGNRSVPSERYWVGNFAIVRDTNCPAVLTENLFQDNKAEVDYLLSDKGKREIVELHVAAIEQYIKQKS